MMVSVSVTEAKRRLSELFQRAAGSQERFLIERRGKPLGAIVSAEDLARLETPETAPVGGGLLAAVGALADVEDFDEIMEDTLRQRARAVDRAVDLE